MTLFPFAAWQAARFVLVAPAVQAAEQLPDAPSIDASLDPDGLRQR
jgi:hypothetical protein